MSNFSVKDAHMTIDRLHEEHYDFETTAGTRRLLGIVLKFLGLNNRITVEQVVENLERPHFHNDNKASR